jgi:hypothetical protein
VIAINFLLCVSIYSGVQFKSPAAGFFFTLGMMLIGAILSWCISACCCRKWRSKEVAYSDLSAENGLSKLASLELAPSSTADKQS